MPSDGSGDPLRVSFDKINQNFVELYTAVGNAPLSNLANIGGNSNVTVIVNSTVSSVAGKAGNVTLYVSDVIGAASQAYVINQVDNSFNQILDGAPTVLDTLREVAAAISNDPQFADNIAVQLTYKLPKTGGTMEGPLYLHADPIDNLQAATKQYVDFIISTKEGPQGIQGNIGPQGDVGPQGIQGNVGPQGDVGPAGAKGDTGLDAYQSALLLGFVGTLQEWLDTFKGAAGPQGDPGLPGADSTVPGPQGDIGPQGLKGDQGNTGIQGIQGNPGAAGTPGAKGDQGNPGIQGDVGPQGDIGPQGVPGSLVTANVAINDTTITSVNTDASITISPNGTGEVHITSDVGISCANPGFSLQVGGDANTSGDVGFMFNDGISFNGTAALGWIWDNGAGLGNQITGIQHAKFGILKNGSVNTPWIEFDKDTPANALKFDATGNAIFVSSIKFNSVPTSAVGQDGDMAGMMAVDANYLYVCSATYDGVTNIWTRTALSGTW